MIYSTRGPLGQNLRTSGVPRIPGWGTLICGINKLRLLQHWDCWLLHCIRPTTSFLKPVNSFATQDWYNRRSVHLKFHIQCSVWISCYSYAVVVFLHSLVLTPGAGTSMRIRDGAQRLITNAPISLSSSLSGTYFDGTWSHRRKTDAETSSKDSFPSCSEYDIAKYIIH